MNQPIRKRLFSGAAGTLALTKRRAASPMMRHAKPTSPIARSGRLVLTLLIMLLTTATAWADTETVSYIDADGHEQTVDATVLTGDEITIYNGWYVVSSDISYTGRQINTGNANIILKDNCTMTMSYDGGTPLNLYNPLTIYGQSGGTGKLVVNTRESIAINGETNTFTVNGGIVESKSTETWGRALFCGSLVFNGGKLKLEGYDGVMGKSNTSKTVTLNWRNATDRVYISSFNNISSVTVGGAGGKCFADADGNYYGGTYTDNFSTLAGKELQPATAYTLTLGSGITTTTEPLFTYSDVDYYAGTVTLPAAPAGWIYAYTVNGAAIDGNTFTITVNTTVSRTAVPDPAHFSVNAAGTEYTIHTADGWDVFCDALQDLATYNRFSGKTVKLGGDIGTAQNPITRMAGSQYHDFCGTFDGQGYTLTFNYGSAESYGSDNYVAPFSYVSTTKADPNDAADSPAAFRNLHVCGDIYTSGIQAGGIVSREWGTVSITNCRSSVNIHSSHEDEGTHGGLVACVNNGSITIEGCLFDGRLLGASTSKCGGFIGWRGGSANIYNSLFAPAEVTVSNEGSATFARNKVDCYNSYYTNAFYDATYAPYLDNGTVSPAKWNNGIAARSITAGENVTISNLALTGTPTEYTVSGITAYSGGGLSRGGNLYYGRDDQLSLTLSNNATGAPLGYRYAGYSVSAGTLSGTTLTMPDANVTVSVDTEVLAPIDWATVNAGTQGDPYMIYNKDQLLLLAHRVNGTHGESDKTYSGKYFKLGADITFSYDPNEGNEYEENYEAIGRYVLGGYYYYFMGDFDGDGYTVSGIRIRKTGNYVDDEYQGLFGWIYNGANIHDVRLTDARIKGHREVGGIVGEIVSGTVRNCTVTESAITATNGHTTIGTICGKNSGGTLSHNYYYGCTVNGNAVTSGKGCYYTDVTENDGAVPFPALIDTADNTATITNYNGQTIPVVLEGRTLYKDGDWNTLCLPFALSAEQIAAHADFRGATLMELDTDGKNGFDPTDGTLYLTFKAATAIAAGVPYLVKWDAAGTDFTSPTFSGVTIDASDNSFDNGVSGDERVRFLGTYKSTTFTDEDKSILFLGAENALYYPQPDIDTENPANSKYPTIGAQRAYFKIGEDDAPQQARRLTAFNIDFGEGEAQGIMTTDYTDYTDKAGAWYDLQGRRVSESGIRNSGLRHGIYIHNGRKVVVP